MSSNSSTRKVQGFLLCRILGFWSVVQAFDFLGCYTAQVGSQFPLKMKLINCPGTSVTSYKPIPHNVPNEQRPQFSLTEIKSVTPSQVLMNTSRIPSINGGLTGIFSYFYLSFISKHCSYNCIAGWLSQVFTSGVRFQFHGYKFITQFASCGSSETVDFKSTHSALRFGMVFFIGPSK